MGAIWSKFKKFVDDSWKDFIDFFKQFGDWIASLGEYVWEDAKWIYYIAKDLILVAGPFFGFFLYTFLTREEVIINR